MMPDIAKDKTADKKHWIQDAVKKPGELHKDLGVPEDEKIPEDKLEEAEHSDSKKVRERAQFAENMKGINKKKSMWHVATLPVPGQHTLPVHRQCPNCGSPMSPEQAHSGMCPRCELENTIVDQQQRYLGKWHLAITGQCPSCGGQMIGNTCPSCGGYADQTGATDGNYQNMGTGLSPNADVMPPAAMASLKLPKTARAEDLQSLAQFLTEQGYKVEFGQRGELIVHGGAEDGISDVTVEPEMGADPRMGKWHMADWGYKNSPPNEEPRLGPDGVCPHCHRPRAPGESVCAGCRQPLPDPHGGFGEGQMAEVGTYGSTHTALGEVQQPTAVGMPAPNPKEDPNYLPMDDVGGLSREQEVAFEKWVDLAVDMLNRGSGEQEILVELAHEGCDDPQAVLARAKEQPLNSDGNLQDPPIPQTPPQDPMVDNSTASGAGDTVSQPPSFQAKVKGTPITGRVEAQWDDLYGRSISRIVTSEGTHDVLTEQIEPMATVEVDPVHVIHEIIDSMPPVEDSRASVQARIENLKIAAKMCRKAIYAKNVTAEQQQEITEVEQAAQVAILDLTDKLTKYKPSLEEYLSQQRTYKIDGYGIEEMLTGDVKVSVAGYEKIMDEHPILVVHDLSPAEQRDPYVVRRAAENYISQYVWELPPATRREMTAAFVESALDIARLTPRDTEQQPKTAAVTDEGNIADWDGPAASLFI